MKFKKIGLTLKNAFLPQGQASTFEDLLRELFRASPELVHRVFDVDFYSQIVFSTLEAHPQNEGVFLRAYVLESQAMGMINLGEVSGSADLLELLPPAGHKFLKREIVLYSVGDRVLSWGMAGLNAQFARLISLAFNQHGTMDGLLSIEDVPKKTTLEELKRVGVRSIDLSITDYMESLPSARNMPEVLKAIFASPISQEEALKRAQAVGRIKLSRGRALKTEEFSKDEYLTRVGEKIFENENEEDFTITLENNRVLHAKNFKVTKSYNVQAYANSVSYPQLKEGLMAFARELSEQGLIP